MSALKGERKGPIGKPRGLVENDPIRRLLRRQFYFWNNVRDFTYSITLSVFTKIAGGTASPSAFAVLRLRINSNLRGVWIVDRPVCRP